MTTTPATPRGSDLAAPTSPMPGINATLRLSAQTLTWLADHTDAHRFVHSVQDTLAELERAGTHPDPLAAARRVLTNHQPTSAGRCRTCPRRAWHRQPFPCIVWHQVHGELLGVLASEPDRQTPSRARTARPADHGQGGR